MQTTSFGFGYTSSSEINVTCLPECEAFGFWAKMESAIIILQVCQCLKHSDFGQNGKLISAINI